MTDSLVRYDEFFFSPLSPLSVLHIGYKTNRVIVGSVFLASVFSLLHLHLSQCVCCAALRTLALVKTTETRRYITAIFAALILCLLMGEKKATYPLYPLGGVPVWVIF